MMPLIMSKDFSLIGNPFIVLQVFCFKFKKLTERVQYNFQGEQITKKNYAYFTSHLDQHHMNFLIVLET